MAYGAKSTHLRQRRRELDWMGALVGFGLIPFHAAQIFSIVDFHVKNEPASQWVMPVLSFAGLFAMPLMFLMAGTGVWHSLRRRAPAEFVRERIRRLVVPFVTGVLLLIPIDVYFQLKADAAYQETYVSFFRRFFQLRLVPDSPLFVTGAPPVELFTPDHLYFLAYLFAFTLLLLPLFLVLRSPSGRHWIARIADLCKRPWAIFLFALPIGAIEAALGTEFAGFWNRYAYLPFILYGFLFAADERFGEVLQRHRKSSLVLALLSFVVWMAGFIMLIEVGRVDPRSHNGLPSVLLRLLKGVTGWSAIVGILGWAAHLDRRASGDTEERADESTGKAVARVWDRLAEYLSEAQLPVYVLHMTPIVVIGFYVVQWPVNALVKYIVITLGSLAATLLLYEIGVRRTSVTRFLFGMKPGEG